MHISEALENHQLTTVPTGLNKFNTTEQLTTGSSRNEGLTKDQVLACDLALGDYGDLISEGFKAWYCKMFYRVGAQRFAILAAQARADGKNPARLFSYLLKKEAGSE